MDRFQTLIEGIGDIKNLTTRSERIVADIAKYVTRIQQFQIAELGTLKAASIERWRTALDIHAQKYYLVQSRIKSIALDAEEEDDVIEEEEDDMDDVMEGHQSLLDSYQTLISQIGLLAEGSVLLKDVTNLCDTVDLSGTIVLEEFQSLKQTCKAFRESVRRVPEHDAVAAVHGRVTTSMTELTGRMEITSACVAANLIEADAMDLSCSKDLSCSLSRIDYEKMISSYKKLQVETRTLPKHEELLGIMARLEPLVTDLRNRVLLDVKAADGSKERTSAIEDKKPESAGHRKNKFKLELPKFSGDPMEWYDYWKMFQTLIESEDLGDVEKIQHLLMSMQSEEAKSIVTYASSGSYTDVVEALEQRFGRRRAVYLEHARVLNSHNDLHDNRDEYIKRRQEITFHMRGLERCGKGDITGSQLLTAIQHMTMDAKVTAKWADFTDGLESPPGIDKLLEFMDKRITALGSNIKVKKPVQKPAGSSGQSASKLKEKWKQSSFHVKSSGEMSKDSCPVCGETHPIYFCPEFKNMDVGKRYDLVKEERLCLNCLGANHSVASCGSKYSCRECHKKHNSLLHRSTEESPTGSGSLTAFGVVCQADRKQQKTGKLIYSPTIVALAKSSRRQRTVRAMLDTGSSSSLITSRFADLLQAKRVKNPEVLETCGGDVNVKYAVEIKLSSRVFPEYEDICFTALVIDELPTMVPARPLGKIESSANLSGLKLADPKFGQSDRIDMLLGMEEVRRCVKEGTIASEDPPLLALKTSFGWAVGGSMPGERQHSCYHLSPANKKTNDELLQACWEIDKVDGESRHHTTDEQEALSQFQDNLSRDPDGRYVVQLPRREPTPVLGESYGRASKRFEQNKKALLKKGKWTEFVKAVQEYPTMGHAEVVPIQDLDQDCSASFYLPMHGVVKEESTTTKLRIVFDGSAQSSTGVSLNDTLLKGPSLYPRLTSVINRFSSHPIAFAADISKMFREVVLDKRERDLHRFIVEGEDGKQLIHRMKRLTFGVTSSPFLATKVLLQMATDQQKDHPAAAGIIRKDFYVDDLLLVQRQKRKPSSSEKKFLLSSVQVEC